MNILVTGGAGYIGSTLVGYLLNCGYKVRVVDNFQYDTSSLNHYCYDPKFDVRKADNRNIDAYKDWVRDADVIIPLAALVGAPICAQDPIGARSVNFDAQKTLFESLSQNQFVVMPTTNSAYGHGLDGNHCDENSPLNPISQYAREKVELEDILLNETSAVSLRLATVFGMSPRMRTDLLVNDFVLRAIRDGFIGLFEGHFKRNYIHVRDVARAMCLMIEKSDQACGEIFNVGLSSANLSKLELCERIEAHVPRLRFHEISGETDQDQRNYIVSNVKIERFGFSPECSLEWGIQELVKGYVMTKKFHYGNV